MVRDAGNETEAKLSTPRLDPEKQGSPQLARDLTALYERLACRTLREGDLIPLDVSGSDGDPQFLSDGFKTKVIDQPDAIIFRHLTAQDGTILDVGAHWGYMAMSILNSGTTCPVLSFEAIPSNSLCLESLRSLAANFDFAIAAVSDKAHEVALYGPVVNGRPLGGVNSIDGNSLQPWQVPLTVEAIENYLSAARERTPAKLQLGIFRTKARALDDLLSDRTFRCPTDRIAAIKIDVEGHDHAVLSGALRTIRRDTPLLLVESSREPAIEHLMTTEGYVIAQRNGDYLVPSREVRTAFNEFFVHSSKAGHYQKIGLLRER